jgi:hypothetical protein
MYDGYQSDEWERFSILLCHIVAAHGDGKTKFRPSQFNFYQLSKKDNSTDAATAERRGKALSKMKSIIRNGRRGAR